ncbi:MAG: helix-turn-helix transcriptional regulator [Chitinophagales bacterium]
MMENLNKNIYAMSDSAILGMLGECIHKVRLSRNITQQELSKKAGITRTTLIRIEKGVGGTLITLIQILRQLEQLQLLQSFENFQQVSPLMLAKIEENLRKRASRKNNKSDYKSDW